MAALQLDDLNWQDGTVRIGAGKSRRADVLPLPVLTGRALVAYLRHARNQEENLRAQRLDTENRVTGQLERVISAQRRHRLLGKLRERRHREWVTELNTEVEQLAADAYLAKFNRKD